MKRIFNKVKADKRIAIGYSASLVLLLITYLVTLLANKQLKERTERVDHTYNVMLNLEMMLSTIKDAETGVRGFALTGNNDFLQPYLNSRHKTDSFFNQIKLLTADSAGQQAKLDELALKIDQRFAILNEGLAYYRKGARDTSYPLKQLQAESMNTMQRIRQIVSSFEKEERYLLQRRDTDLNATFASIKVITITSLLLTLLLVIIGFVTYTNENKARKTAMQNIKEYQQQLSNRIDELNKANAQLLQMRSMEKFAATGRIARTIAHEVRNPLTNIDLATGQLKSEFNPAEENTLHLFSIVERNSSRINKLISDLLQTTKFAELNFDRLTANELLDEALTMANDRIKLHGVQLRKTYNATGMIKVDKEKMKIALLNIIINAVEAMEPGKGILKIITEADNQVCKIAIQDNGTGMDENTVNKLFEPYFTAKKNGNGLGLANTQNIIFNHNGTIEVVSAPGMGTTFTITLANDESQERDG